MTAYWVDVEDASGNKLGDGPITSITDWTYTSRLDAAGSFSFTMPRDDPRAALVLPRRKVRCWGYDGGAVQYLGAGIIIDVRTQVDDSGRAMLAVSGDNLLAELINRIIPLDTFDKTVWIHPARAGYMNVGTGVFTPRFEWHNLLVGDTTSWYDNDGGNSIRLDTPYTFNRVDFVLHSSSQGGGTHNGGFAEYWNGTGWTAFTPHTNTTIVSGDWFAQSGYIEWYDDDVSFPENPDPNQLVRFRADTVGWLECEIADVSIRVTLPTNDALSTIIAYAPTGWTLDAVNGYTETQDRPLGSEMLTDGGFETYTGTPNDTTSDNWTHWSEINSDGDGASSLAITSTKHGGSACVKLTCGGSLADAAVYQIVTVEPSTEYTLSYWTQGDGGSGQVINGIYDEINGSTRFYYADSGITAATWTQVHVVFTTPASCTSIKVLFYNPGTINTYALVDDVSLKTGGGDAIVLDSVGETVLENFIRVAETTGEHFTLGATDQLLLWLGNDTPSSGMRAIANVDSVAVEGESGICLIQTLTETEGGADLISRIYPYGGGADPIPTLRNTTRVVPTGYVLDKTNNYIERTASIAEYGVIERRLDLPDVTNVTGNTMGDIHSCNMLFDRALLYLQRHSATDLTQDTGDAPRTFNLQLAKCDEVLSPGYTLRVEYDRYVAGVKRMTVNGDYLLLSSTIRADNNGIRTVAVQCSNIDIELQTDDTLIADMLRRQRSMLAHG